MTEQSGHDPDEVIVAQANEVTPGTTKKFMLPLPDAPVEAFVVNFEGELHAWVNRCRHVPLTMDWVENRFLDESGTHIVCATHGAMYEPNTGECIAGPAFGRSLIRVPIRVAHGQVLARIPEELR